MTRRSPLFRLLVIPIMVILLCNPVSMTILGALSWYFVPTVKTLIVVLFAGYGLFLLISRGSKSVTDESPVRATNWTRQHNRAAGEVLSDCRPNHGPVSNWGVLAIIGGLAVIWSAIVSHSLIWIMGMGILFSFMRMHILKYDLDMVAKDFLAVAIGLMASLFLYPISFSLSLCAFLLIQVLFEMRIEGKDKYVQKDRFRDSFKTAEEILKKFERKTV